MYNTFYRLLTRNHVMESLGANFLSLRMNYTYCIISIYNVHLKPIYTYTRMCVMVPNCPVPQLQQLSQYTLCSIAPAPLQTLKSRIASIFSGYVLIIAYPTTTVQLLLKLKLKLSYDRRSVGQSVLVSGSFLELLTRFFLFDNCGFLAVGRPL
jgi:hypothetical protein